MKIKSALALTLGMGLLFSCGKTEEETTSAADPVTAENNAATEKLTTGTLMLNYALNALSSATVSSGTSLNLVEEGQSTTFPRCSVNGEPWDATQGKRMEPSNTAYAEQTFYCQLNFPTSVETVLGSLMQNRRVICDMERVVGTLEYTTDGKVYADTLIQPTLGCGWDQRSVDEMSKEGLKGTITATQYTSGDWDRLLHIEVPKVINFKLYMKASNGIVSFKQIETWTQKERTSKLRLLGDANSFVAADAEGTGGTVVTIDLNTGVLRAEIGSTYWGRRTRLLATGTFDKEAGKFTALTELNGIQGNFDKGGTTPATPGLYGEYATIKGTSAAGYKAQSYRYKCTGTANACTFGTSVATAVAVDTALSSTACIPSTAACTGNTGLAIDPATDTGFLTIGAAWDTNGGTRKTYEEWIKAAGPLTFTSLTLSTVLN